MDRPVASKPRQFRKSRRRGRAARAAPAGPGEPRALVHPFGDRAYYFVRYDHEGEKLERRVGAFDGAAHPRDGRSALPELLHDLHYFRQLGEPGRVASGIVALFGVVVLLSGLLLHWDKLPRRLHGFRTHRGWRWWVTDAHTTLGVLGIPYTLMYCLTGAFFGLLVVILGPTALVVFGGDTEAVEQHLTGVRTPEPAPLGAEGPLPDLGEVVRWVEQRWGSDIVLFRTDVIDWGDRSAKWVVEGAHAKTLATSGKVVASVATMEVLDEQRPEEANILGRTISVITNLHFSRLGHPAFDALFFLLALLSCAVILTGNVLWLSGRSPFRLDAGRWLDRGLGRATIGVALGLVVAVPAALTLTRLIPLDSAGRAAIESAFFFSTWLGISLFALSVRDPLRLGKTLLGLAAFFHFAAPALNAAMTARPFSDFATLSVDVGLVSGGALCFALRRIVATSPDHPRSSIP